MLNIFLESISAVLVALILVKFYLIQANRVIREQSGWKLIFAGTVLVLAALIFDVSDNFPALNFLIIFGDTAGEAFLEKLSYFSGYLLLALGFWQWLPVLSEREELRADLQARNKSLEEINKVVRLREDLYGSITDAANEAIFILGGQGQIVFCNPAAERIFGYNQQELLGENLHLLLAPERYHESFRRGFTEFLKGGGGRAVGQTLEAAARKKDGQEFPVEISVSPIKYGHSWHALGILRDVTERKESEEERLRLARQLRQAQKMEAMGTLAGGIAHDFNNILTAIIGYGEMVLEELPADSQVLEDQEHLLRAGNRARDLVKQILTFSRQSEQELQPLQIQFIVKEALKLLRASIPSTIKIRQEVALDCPAVLADPAQIHQAVMNLCTNAYHAMREGGGVMTVSLSSGELREDELPAQTHLQPGHFAILAVSDTGCGMDPLTMERIFEPYFTTKEQGEGTGLGLSLVHGIALGLGGGISVTSELDRGSTLKIYLPVTETGEVGRPAEASLDSPRGHETILVVDDEEDIVLLERRFLEKAGFRVAGFTDSLKALTAFLENPEAFDLVITDMTMPGLTGIGLAEQLLAVRPGLPIVLCTGFSELISETRAKELGISEYLLKPLSRAELVEVVRRALDNKTQVAEA